MSAGGQTVASGGAAGAFSSGGTANAGGLTGTGGAASTGGASTSAASFDWPEADPGGAACTPGKYVGRFSCEMSFIPGFPPSVVEGPVTFTLEPTASGEFLEIKEGRLEATAYDSIPFSCDLVGKLDCSTLAFQAKAANGTYGTPPFGGVFFGDMQGALNGATSTLAGDWSLAPGVEGMGPTVPCKGPWSVVLTP